MPVKFRLPKLSRKEVERDELFLAQGLKTVALSFASVFIPIYLYQLGYGLTGLLASYIAFELAWLLFMMPAGYAIARFGPNKVLIVSYILTLSYLFILTGIKNSPAFLALFVVLAGAAIALESAAVHTEISAAKERGKTGRDVATYEIIIKIGSTIGPFVGGAIATVFGTEDLFMSAAVMVALGALPLLATKDIVRQHRVDYRSVKWQNIRREAISIGGRAVPVVMGGQLWPVYIFLSLGTLAGVGAVHSLANGLGILAIVLSAQLIDSGSSFRSMKLGVWIEFAGNGLRIAASSFAPFMGAQLLGSIGGSLMNGAWLSRFYDRAGSGHRIEYIIKVNIAARLWAVAAAAVALLLVQFLPELLVMKIGFLLAGLAGFLVLLMPMGARGEGRTVLGRHESVVPSRP